MPLPQAPAAGRRPAVEPLIVVRGPHVDTGKYFLEIRYDQRASSKKADRKMITSEHENYPGAPSFLGCMPMKSWCTAAACGTGRNPSF